MQIDLDYVMNLVRREIFRFQARNNRKMVGFIDSYRDSDHTAKVRFETDLDANGKHRITGWLPIRCQAGGAAVSWVAAPAINDQCTVEYVEGDSEAGAITGFLHNVKDTPPGVKSSEAILRHTKSGNRLYLAEDGSLRFEHKDTGNHLKMTKSGDLVGYIADPGKTQHYIGGSPEMGGTFARVQTEQGPSPYSKARIG